MTGSTLLLLTAVVGVGGGSLLLVLTLAVLSRPREATGVRRSLALIEASRTERGLARHELPARERLVAPFLDALTRLGRRLSPTQAPARLQRLLDFAGNPRGWNVESVLAAKGGGAVAGLAVGVALLRLDAVLVVLVPVLVGGGAYLPDVALRNAGQRRQVEIRRSLADALDMLTVCVEAGLGFDAAMLQVARKTEGAFARELSRALQEVQLGRARSDALQLMADRVDVHELQSFVTAMGQADRLGIPVARVLREQSHQMRQVRRQDAEERAQKVTVKILFPVIFCILPALVVVVMGPAVLTLVRTFSTTVPGAP